MNQKLLRIQLGGCAALSLTLITEWGLSHYNHQQIQSLLSAPSQTEVELETLPVMQMDSKPLEAYNAIIERPLFLDGRTPIVQTLTPDAPKTEELGKIDEWTLIGIFNKNHTITALFNKTNEVKKFQKLHQDQTLSGWQIKQILPDRVLLEQAGQSKELVLRKIVPSNKAKNPRVPGTNIPQNPAAAGSETAE